MLYYKSRVRWKTTKPLDDPNFDPLDGAPSKWEDVKAEYGFRPRRWMHDTLPSSPDFSVIGSIDEEECCCESMFVCTDKIDYQRYKKIVFVASIYQEYQENDSSRGFTFKDVDATVKIVDRNNNQLFSLSLTEQYPDNDTVCFGALVWDKRKNGWSLDPMSMDYNGGIVYLIQNIF